jgi:hypothetical protein
MPTIPAFVIPPQCLTCPTPTQGTRHAPATDIKLFVNRAMALHTTVAPRRASVVVHTTVSAPLQIIRRTAAHVNVTTPIMAPIHVGVWVIIVLVAGRCKPTRLQRPRASRRRAIHPLVQGKLWNTGNWPPEEEPSEPGNPLTEELGE